MIPRQDTKTGYPTALRAVCDDAQSSGDGMEGMPGIVEPSERVDGPLSKHRSRRVSREGKNQSQKKVG